MCRIKTRLPNERSTCELVVNSATRIYGIGLLHGFTGGYVSEVTGLTHVLVPVRASIVLINYVRSADLDASDFCRSLVPRFSTANRPIMLDKVAKFFCSPTSLIHFGYTPWHSQVGSQVYLKDVSI